MLQPHWIQIQNCDSSGTPVSITYLKYIYLEAMMCLFLDQFSNLILLETCTAPSMIFYVKPTGMLTKF